MMPTSPGPAVDLRGACRHYRTRGGVVRAVDDVDLRVAAGERIAIMGPSGSGKSTLLALVAGLERPSGGAVEVLGTDLGRCSREQRARFRRHDVGFVFQSLDLLPFLTAAENVALGIGVAHAQAPLDAYAMLSRLGLADQADRLADQLSGGEQERVAIARALAHRPRLVLGDEPTGSLDSASSAVAVGFFLDAIAEIGATAIVVTHDPVVAARFDRTVVMRDGRVGVEGAASRQRPSTC